MNGVVGGNPCDRVVQRRSKIIIEGVEPVWPVHRECYEGPFPRLQKNRRNCGVASLAHVALLSALSSDALGFPRLRGALDQSRQLAKMFDAFALAARVLP